MLEDTISLAVRDVFEQDQDKLIIAPYLQDDLPSHTHHFFELVYVTNGTCNHTMGENTGCLTPGDYFIIDYDSPHSYSCSQSLSLINCLFLPEILDETLRGCQSFDSLLHRCFIRYYSPSFPQAPVNRIFRDDDGRILSLLKSMRREYMEKAAGYPEILRCQLIEVLVHFMRSVIQTNTMRPQSSVILQAIRYVDEHYMEPITLSGFSRSYFFSLQYISRKFKQETGITFQEYLQHRRIEKSCELLAGNDMRIVEIARAVGYGDAKYFTRIFKRAVSFTPRQYKKQFFK